MVLRKINHHGIDCLIAADDAAVKKINGMDNDRILFVDIHEARNYPQLKLFWSMCRTIADNHRLEHYADLDTARKVAEWAKLKLGYFDYTITMGGRTHIKTKSISYNRMTQEEWRKFFDAALPILDSLINYNLFDIPNDEGGIEDDR
jgi:hypothetical protein